MRRSTWTLLITIALALPAAAQAGPLASLRGAKLHAVTGSLTINESRCPQGAGDCGNAELQESFVSGSRPKTASAAGRPGFRSGLRIRGKGSGRCSAESPSTFVTGPDGSMQFLGGASRFTPGHFKDTRVAMAGGRKGARVVWLEPLRPSLACNYFDEPGSDLSVPQLSDDLVSRAITLRTLKRRRFSVTITGSQQWARTDADGTQVKGRASWNLRLDYRRP